MSKKVITTSEMRRAIKAMGLKVRVKSFSEFSAARVFDGDAEINAGNVLTQEHLDKYADFYAFRNAHSVVDEGWRTVL